MTVEIALSFNNEDEALDVAEELKLAATHDNSFDDVLWRVADQIVDQT